jgi:hypothetical protein
MAKGVTLTLIVNLVIGALLVIMGFLAFTDQPGGRWITLKIRDFGQKKIGEYWNIHEWIVGGILMFFGAFFLFVALSIFGKAHQFWVLDWF